MFITGYVWAVKNVCLVCFILPHILLLFFPQMWPQSTPQTLLCICLWSHPILGKISWSVHWFPALLCTVGIGQGFSCWTLLSWLLDCKWQSEVWLLVMTLAIYLAVELVCVHMGCGLIRLQPWGLMNLVVDCSDFLLMTSWCNILRLPFSLSFSKFLFWVVMLEEFTLLGDHICGWAFWGY